MTASRDPASSDDAIAPSHALGDCAVTRVLDGRVEIVVASAARRSFTARVGESLGLCLKTGAAHEVRADGRRLQYPADALCLRAPGCIWSTDDTGPVGFLSVDLDRAALPEGLTSFPMTFARADAIPLHRFVTALRASTVASEQHVVDLLSRLHDAGLIRASQTRTVATHAQLARARECLENGISRPPALGALAQAAGTNRFALLRSFRRAYGVTPHAFVTMLRIDRARNRIARGAELIEIAHELGFADQPHFSRVFKRSVGMTPGQYARNVRAISFKRIVPVRA